MAKRTVSVAYEDPRFSKKEAAYWKQVRDALDAMGAPNSGELLHNSKTYVEGVHRAGLPAIDAAAVIWHKHCQSAGTAAVPCVAEDSLSPHEPWVLLEPGVWEWRTNPYPPGGYAIIQLTRKRGFQLGRWDSRIGRPSFAALAIYPSLEGAQNAAAMYAALPGGREEGGKPKAAAECPCETEESGAACPPDAGEDKKKNGLQVVYSPVNQAYFLMWHTSILRVFLTKQEALDEKRRLLGGLATSSTLKTGGYPPVPDDVDVSKISEARDSAAPSCVPFTRLERNNEAFAACQAIAKGPLESDADMYRLLSAQLGKEDQEVFVVVGLDLHRNLRSYTEVARGQRDRVAVNVEDVLRAAILDGPHGFVVAHNHPSGKANPSPADRDLTKRIRAGAAVGCPSIVFLDHIVVGQGEYFSFADNKLKRVR